jgi:prephenate dehydrogenase
MALKKRGLAEKVIGIGRSPDRLKRAEELTAVDVWSTDLESAVGEVDLVYVSTPVGLELDFIRRMVPSVKADCVITDAGSTKAEICRGADALVEGRARFVGGHPMAGSEETGVEAAHPDLFEGATYVLTPTASTDPEALAVVRKLAEAIGSRVVLLSPEVHDRCVAVISHLPHLIAASLVSLAEEHSVRDPQVFELIAGSFRDMTRVAGSSPVLWRDICLTNADPIADAAERFKRLLDEGITAISAGDGDSFEEWFAKAKQVRDKLFPRKS